MLELLPRAGTTVLPSVMNATVVMVSPFRWYLCIIALTRTIQVLPWPIGCMILVPTTTVTPAARMTGIVLGTATEIDTTTPGMMTGATMIDGPGTTTGGISVLFNRKFPSRYNATCSLLSTNVHRYRGLQRYIWIIILSS